MNWTEVLLAHGTVVALGATVILLGGFTAATVAFSELLVYRRDLDWGPPDSYTDLSQEDEGEVEA